MLREGRVELAHDADPAGDGTLLVRAAAAAATTGTALGRTALERLADRGRRPGRPVARRRPHMALVDLLGSGRPAIAVLEAIDQKGLLVRMLPEWAKVRSRPQRNAYHRFTVDRHLCEAAAGAAAHAGQGEPARPAAGRHLAARHRQGLHARAGRGPQPHRREVMGTIATRMGFAADDVAVLCSLVRHHLLLADAATRRDLDDESTISAVADALGDPVTLELLHALTEADSLATGPAAWSEWKAGLVTDLVERVAAHMAGEPVPATAASFPTPDGLDLVAQAGRNGGSLLVQGKGMSVTIAAPDRPGLFSRVAGTLTIHGLDVLAARAWSGGDGLALEEFEVRPVFGGDPDWAEVEADLDRALSGRLSLEAGVADRARRYARVGREAPGRDAGRHDRHRRQPGVEDGHRHRGACPRLDRHALSHHPGPGRAQPRHPPRQGRHPRPRGRRQLLRRRRRRSQDRRRRARPRGRAGSPGRALPAVDASAAATA